MDEGAGFGMARMTGMMAVRTRLIDDYFADAVRRAFLPSDAQDRLLDNVTALSAPGSRFIAKNMPGREGDAASMQDCMHETVDRWRAHGFDIEMTDLWYFGDRHDVADYLNARGWQTDQTTMAELFAECGQTLAGSADETADFGSFTYVTAITD